VRYGISACLQAQEQVTADVSSGADAHGDEMRRDGRARSVFEVQSTSELEKGTEEKGRNCVMYAGTVCQ
jgi:hypothetical protein